MDNYQETAASDIPQGATENFKKRKIVILGSGFVGTATGKGFLSKGNEVAFIDVNPLVIENLKNEKLKAGYISDEIAKNGDLYMVNILTPTFNDHIDLRFIDSALISLGEVIIKHAVNYPVVVIRSTVPPGTTEKRFLPILEKYSGKKAGTDFGICMNPEFLRQATAVEDFMQPKVIVIGSNDPKVGLLMEELYKPFGAPIYHLAIKEAEMLKYIHNLYNASKISFFNEMRAISGAIGADADKMFKIVMESAEASWNKQYGIKDMGPYNGSCLPKDTLAFLNWTNELLDRKMPLLHSIIQVNEHLKNKKYFGY